MKFFYIPKSDNEFTAGKIYKLTKTGKVFVANIKLSEKTKLVYKISLICQLVAEGLTLHGITSIHNFLPLKLEFYNILEHHPEWKEWYIKAQDIRNKIMIDRTYEALKSNKALLEGKDIDKLLSILKAIQDAIKDNESHDGIRSLTNVEVFDIPILKKKGWGVE